MRLMNSSVEEFRRALVRAFGEVVSETASGLLLEHDGVQIHFTLTRESPRRIGALQLEMLRVEISVRSGDEEAAEKLLAKVDRATQRGGG